MLQYLDNELAWWFNVGVQMFLFISGYLYGCKYYETQIDIPKFYKKRITKILLPYFFVVFIALLIHIFVLHEPFSRITVFQLFICNTLLPGGEHLWFVSTILLCYTITPIIIQFFTKTDKQIKFAISFVIVCISVFITFSFFVVYYNPAWIICYIIGLAYGVNTQKHIIKINRINIFLFFLTLQNMLQIINNYCYQIINPENTYYKIWCDFNHVWLGIAIFIILKLVFSKISFENSKILVGILNVSDKYSYEGYLVHQFIILGPLSLMNLTNSLGLNVLLILVLICVLAFVINVLEKLVLKIPERKNVKIYE